MNAITVVVNSLGTGGAEKVTVLLCNYFVSIGLKVDLVLIRYRGKYLPQLDKRVNVLQTNERLIRLGFVGRVVALWQSLRRLDNSTILSIGEWPNVTSPFSRVLLDYKPRLILCEHNTRTFINHPEEYKLSKIYQSIARSAYRRADAIVAVSEQVKQSVVAAIPSICARTVVINNPIDLERINRLGEEALDHRWVTNKKTPLLIAVGRLQSTKDYPTMLKAISYLKNEQNELSHLLILGEGDLAEELRAMTRELAIDEIVEFMGFVENPYKYYSHADLFVHSAIYEGFPMVFIEAFACGLSIASTDCNIPKEIFYREDMELVVPIGDHRLLAQAISKGLRTKRDPESAKRRVEKFNVHQIGREYMHVISGEGTSS
ncbi:glycosyltransferase [Imperialibacter roseus]|uniref:Glycosyltransferase n=1 Tax=Imperialibacter roseus TaxID=1324217 RepID=A0ABZ0IQ25_9BACT|nr:glycosyltransferase [Imperialibacter roseus]WOK06284.1 glycosyltransferase [Imperialibacter roseus]